MEQKKRVTLDEVLNYKSEEMYITIEDASLIRNTFKGNPRLIYALRKLLLPSIGDSNLPIEQLADDLWLTGINWSQIPDKEIPHLVVARELAIKFIIGGLIKLKVIAATDDLTAAQKALKFNKDSGK